MVGAVKLPSSHALHPQSGARYVFHRLSGPPAATYEALIYSADGATIRALLTWDSDGRPQIEPAIADLSLYEQVIKLARALRSDHPARLTRWRG